MAATQDELKQQAALKAVEYVKSGMKLGLGTGSTAALAVARIGELMKAGTLKDIVAVPTSIATKNQAEALGIPLATLDEVPVLDLAIDGSDEVDGDLNLVKGRGGALLREKMVELASKKFVCIVDDSKGCVAKLRLKPNSSEPYVTDNANYIIDLYFETPMKDANAAGKAIGDLVGVVEHGLFLNMCDVCIVAGKNGVEVKERNLNRKQ